MGRATEFKRIRKNTADNERNHPHHSDTDVYTKSAPDDAQTSKAACRSRIRIASDCSRGGLYRHSIGQAIYYSFTQWNGLTSTWIGTSNLDSGLPQHQPLDRVTQ